jgi:hypothetical protein
MSNPTNDERPVDSLFRRRYPDLSEEELRDAEANFVRYLDGALRIYERLLADPDAYARFVQLVEKKKSDRLE